MKDVLIILNPRRIRLALESFARLDIDRIWIRNLWLTEIEQRWPEVEAALDGYDWAWIVSDDVVVTQASLNAVRDLAADHPVVTGYCQVAANDERVHLTRSPLGEQSVADAYDFYTLPEVDEFETVAVPTTFAAFCLTGMSVEMWRTYPFGTEREGHAADFNLCKRLERDGHLIVGHRDAFCLHLKEEWGRPDRDPTMRLWCGDAPSSIDVEVLA